MIKLRINVKQIDKARLYHGERGIYLDAVLIETPNDAYGNSHMIVQEVSKDERLAGTRGNILGNAKTLGQAPQPQPQQPAPERDPDNPQHEDDIPF